MTRIPPEITRRNAEPAKLFQNPVSPVITVDATDDNPPPQIQLPGQLMGVHGEIQRGAAQCFRAVFEDIEENFPDPDNPVITTNLSRGMSRSIFFKLFFYFIGLQLYLFTHSSWYGQHLIDTRDTTNSEM